MLSGVKRSALAATPPMNEPQSLLLIPRPDCTQEPPCRMVQGVEQRPCVSCTIPNAELRQRMAELNRKPPTRAWWERGIPNEQAD